jgi:carboxylate-amine ligase
VWALVDYLSPVLDDQGELALVKAGIAEILGRGNGALEQRDSAARYSARHRDGGNPPGSEALAAVVSHAAKVTVRGTATGAFKDPVPLLTRVRRP